MKAGTVVRISFEILLVFGFFVVGLYTVLSIYGYKYDNLKKNFEKTSIIDVGGYDDDLIFWFDGEKVSKKLPYMLRGVLPGVHHISVEKQGFYPFSAVVQVFPDIVTRIDSVVLLPVKLEFALVEDISSLKLDFVSTNEFYTSDMKNRIFLNGSELWREDFKVNNKELVTRFHTDVDNIKYFSDDYHFLYTSKNRLNFCDMLFQNCFDLRGMAKGDAYTVLDDKIYIKNAKNEISALDLSRKSIIGIF